MKHRTRRAGGGWGGDRSEAILWRKGMGQFWGMGQSVLGFRDGGE
ncbi:MAG: hypothetical protein NTU53_07865 [Planctomycetota bacterium]|nr:hypothetical protein [Planctomycetota bacterium]